MNKTLIATSSGQTELDRLEGEIAARRESLVESLTGLRDEVAELTDWRTWVRRQPLRAVLISVAAGWVAGKLIRFG